MVGITRSKVIEPKMLFFFYNCTCTGLHGGTHCGPVFCNFFKVLEKETTVLKKGIFPEFVKICFVCDFEKHSLTILKKINPYSK